MSYIIIFYDQYDSKENNLVWNAIGNATYDPLTKMYVISTESQKRLEHILTENKIMYKISEKVPKIVKFKLKQNIKVWSFGGKKALKGIFLHFLETLIKKVN